MIQTIQKPVIQSRADHSKQSKILLLEDNMISLQMHTDILESAGFVLEYSIAGNNLSELLFSNSFDLVLVGLFLEGIGEFDLIKKIRRSERNAGTPVVFISDYHKKEDRMQGLHIPGIDFLQKPYAKEELLTRINNQIAFHRNRKELEQHRLIDQSIQYAQRIQKAMSVPESRLDALFHNNFLISIPRDVVSGDFFWVHKQGSKTIVALADCTGHGVPGAFLSILGNSLLDEITVQQKVTTAGAMLDTLREKFKHTFLKNDSPHPLSDGMDISLLIHDTRKNELQLASAFQKILIQKKDDLIVLRGDMQPIGLYPAESKFKNYNVKVEAGTKIFMTTDGFVDQFGGPHQKKYQFSRYKELIRTTAQQSLQAQKDALLKSFREWQGINEQVDDIMIMGLEI